MAQPSSAVQRLVKRRRRATQLGILAALLVAGLFLSVHWWQRPPSPSTPGRDTPWNTLSSPTGGFTVRLPGLPQEKTRSVTLVNHPVMLHEYATPAGEITYVAGYADAPAGIRSALSPAELLDAARADYEAILGGHVVDSHPLTDKPFPGREWRLDAGGAGPAQRSIVRVYLIDGRLFHLAATGPAPFDQLVPAAAKLFDSFQPAGGAKKS